MKNSRLLTIVGAVTVTAGLSAAAIGPRPALAGTTACGAAGIAGASSCAYSTVGSGTFTVPDGVREATFTVEGAQGGSSPAGSAGAPGGQVSAALPVSPGQVMQVNVGGQGQAGSASAGGISDVLTGSPDLADSILAAGGGAGGTDGGAGGAGGINYISPAATLRSSSAGVRYGNGMVIVSWQKPTSPTASPAMAGASGQALSPSGLGAPLTGPDGPLAVQPGLPGGDCGCGADDAVLREWALRDMTRTAWAAW